MDARAYNIKDVEIGIEYPPLKNFEFVASWCYAEKWTSDKVKKDNMQIGSFLRLQAQLNFYT